MESCRFPIDVCELIMDFVKSEPVLFAMRKNVDPIYKTLRSCALTCRAWRPRAQYLLWQEIQITGPIAMEVFTDAFRRAHVATTSKLRYLVLDFNDRLYGMECFNLRVYAALRRLRLNELFLTHKARNLRTFVIYFPHSHDHLPLYSRVLRARLPLLARITTLELCQIRPSFARMVLDFMWTCPDLSSCTLYFTWPTPRVGESWEIGEREHPVTDAAFQHLAWTSKPSGACRKLTKVVIDFESLQQGSTQRNPTMIRPPLSALFRNRTMFGSHIQYISLTGHAPELREYTHFLADGDFPALQCLRMKHNRNRIPFHVREANEPSIMELLAQRIRAPTNLKRVIVEDELLNAFEWHKARPAGCKYCWDIIGVDAGWDLPLRERFGRPDPELFFRVPMRSCADHIVQIAPHLRSTLNIYCPREEGRILLGTGELPS
ncbi:hypothetical protein C2E23DRAFT_895866 [Lenzites betulinus]|nr:hypothetical protein C2E23DRAFT_895866 [Lenzites betulinus]